MQPAGTNRYRDPPGDLHISCRHQFQATTPKVHYAYLCRRIWPLTYFVGCAIEGEHGLGSSTDQFYCKSGFTLHLLNKSSAIAGLANRFCCYDKDRVCAMFLRQGPVLLKKVDSCSGFLLRDLSSGGHTLADAHLLDLVFYNIEVIGSTASNNDMDSIAT